MLTYPIYEHLIQFSNMVDKSSISKAKATTVGGVAQEAVTPMGVESKTQGKEGFKEPQSLNGGVPATNNIDKS